LGAYINTYFSPDFSPLYGKSSIEMNDFLYKLRSGRGISSDKLPKMLLEIEILIFAKLHQTYYILFNERAV